MGYAALVIIPWLVGRAFDAKEAGQGFFRDCAVLPLSQNVQPKRLCNCDLRARMPVQEAFEAPPHGGRQARARPVFRQRRLKNLQCAEVPSKVEDLGPVQAEESSPDGPLDRAITGDEVRVVAWSFDHGSDLILRTPCDYIGIEQFGAASARVVVGPQVKKKSLRG